VRQTYQEGCERTNLAQTRREYDDLKNLTHFFQKVVNAWALDYVDIVPVILDFNRHNIVCLLNRLDSRSDIDLNRSMIYDEP
jgi:hypothetical protein